MQQFQPKSLKGAPVAGLTEAGQNGGLLNAVNVVVARVFVSQGREFGELMWSNFGRQVF